MAGTAQDVLDVARSQIGCTDGAKYFEHFDMPDLGPWCVAFVRYCMDVAGVDFDWSTWYAWDWSDAPNPIAPKDFEQADGVSFDWDDDGSGDHVGIFDRFETRDGVAGFWSYEGNTSGGVVAHKWRPLSCAICGIRPTFKKRENEWRFKDGRWWYRHADGSYTKDDWEKIDGKWYRFDKDGWMLASTVIEDRGDFYALGPSGAMLTDIKTNPEHDGTFGRLILS